MLEYQHLTNDELLHLADEREQLTDEARLALDAELSRRRLSTSDLDSFLDSFKQQCAAEEEADKLRRAAPQLMAHGSFGKKLFGKAQRRRDRSGLFELYESTLWFCSSVVPIISHCHIHREARP